MKTGIFFLISFVLTSLISCHNEKPHYVETDLSHQTPKYRKDKNEIERKFIDNIESVRLARRQMDGFAVKSDSINDEIEPTNSFFDDYVLLYNETSEKEEVSPVRTDKRIPVAADTIVYYA